MTGIIYKITNKVNGKLYIGQTIQTLKDRWYRHCCNVSDVSEQQMVIKKAIHKYGKENFTIEVIEECSEELLDEKEIYWIAYYNTYYTGYNSTKGGKRDVKIDSKVQQYVKDIIELYNLGFSLRQIAKEYNVDHATVRQLLRKQGISLRSTRNYKLTSEIRKQIINEVNKGVSRKEIIEKYKISKSYLSQLINGVRRI